jgi:hypothetical protein
MTLLKSNSADAIILIASKGLADKRVNNNPARPVQCPTLYSYSIVESSPLSTRTTKQNPVPLQQLYT